MLSFNETEQILVTSQTYARVLPAYSSSLGTGIAIKKKNIAWSHLRGDGGIGNGCRTGLWYHPIAEFRYAGRY